MTSIDIDPGLTKAAADPPARLCYHLTIVTGDGYCGHRAGAPYGRMIVTCSVPKGPAPWIAQTRPAGTS